jgi:uncharacterized protein (TIGR00369 family)
MTISDPEAGSAAAYVAAMPEGAGNLNEKMGIELTAVAADRVVGTMPVEGNTQPYGLLHGGASVVFAETLGSVGASIHGETMGKLAVGVDINATHHRGVRAGVILTGVATAVHLGKSTAVYDVVITDEADRRIASSRITCSLVQPSGTL